LLVDPSSSGDSNESNVSETSSTTTVKPDNGSMVRELLGFAVQKRLNDGKPLSEIFEYPMGESGTSFSSGDPKDVQLIKTINLFAERIVNKEVDIDTAEKIFNGADTGSDDDDESSGTVTPKPVSKSRSNLVPKRQSSPEAEEWNEELNKKGRAKRKP
jgi:hypothetical protein